MTRINFGYYTTFAILGLTLLFLGGHLYEHNKLAVIDPYTYQNTPELIETETFNTFIRRVYRYPVESAKDYTIYISVYGDSEDLCNLQIYYNTTLLLNHSQDSGTQYRLYQSIGSSYSFLEPFQVNETGDLEFIIDNYSNSLYDIRLYEDLPQIFTKKILLLILFSLLGIAFWTAAYLNYQKIMDKFYQLPID